MEGKRKWGLAAFSLDKELEPALKTCKKLLFEKNSSKPMTKKSIEKLIQDGGHIKSFHHLNEDTNLFTVTTISRDGDVRKFKEVEQDKLSQVLDLELEYKNVETMPEFSVYVDDHHGHTQAFHHIKRDQLAGWVREGFFSDDVKALVEDEFEA
ncbi:hypothetical protein HDU92_005704 [Lobulomyces angularis]|nr:hypothetical protein HDU92_005704 [Lobulomyces angularis]